jgi:hypothetical protein
MNVIENVSAYLTNFLFEFVFFSIPSDREICFCWNLTKWAVNVIQNLLFYDLCFYSFFLLCEDQASLWQRWRFRVLEWRRKFSVQITRDRVETEDEIPANKATTIISRDKSCQMSRVVERWELVEFSEWNTSKVNVAIVLIWSNL